MPEPLRIFARARTGGERADLEETAAMSTNARADLTPRVLAEAFGPSAGAMYWTKNLALLLLGVAAYAIAAKIQVPTWPVPTTMQAFVALMIGAAYGPRLALTTSLSYLALGAAGAPVFAGGGGLAYFAGPTGGYLIGFAAASWIVGLIAQRGAGNVLVMAAAMIAGLAAIYLPGAAWIGAVAGADKVWSWGVHPFLWIDLAKAALAALILPAIWRLIGRR